VITLVAIVPEVVYAFSGQTPLDISNAAAVARTGRAVGGITRMARVMRMMQIVATVTTIYVKFRGSTKNMFGICPLKLHDLCELLRLSSCMCSFYIFLTYSCQRTSRRLNLQSCSRKK
jgi:hypothetical protein